MAAGSDPIRDGAVLLGADGAIAAVGSFAELSDREPDATVAGDGNGIVMPGMVNAHTHLTECLIPGMGEDAVLYEWFQRVVNPVGELIVRDEVALGTRLKAVEMLRSGITTVNDMSCHRNVGSLATLGAVDGLAWAGLRGVVSFGAEDMYEGAPGPEPFMAEHEALADRTASEPLISFRCGVGTVLGLSDQLFERTVSACREHGWAVHTHLSEVREELTEGRLRWGGTTIERSGRAGLLDAEVIAAHCIWCTERDIGLLGRHDVAVAHNPVANMLLGNGVCPVPRLRSEGITIALGTDGAASNDNQDMFGVIKTAGLLHKVNTMDPTVIGAREVLAMATIDGARALGIDAEVGSLEPGKRADVVLLDGNTPELATIHDPWQQVVYCATARCVSDVWVDGVRRVEGGEVPGVDLPALAAEVREAGADLARRSDLGSESVYAGDGRAFAGAGA
ncbi:MAG: amidohydrolase [Acidobacteria bacterium]|nr:MAG: amidohydrolase [Acidobacteriota bacterium]MCL4286125.1 amidohydrolase [Thermoleophilia bacterium]